MHSDLDEESTRALEDAARRLATVRPKPRRHRGTIGDVFVSLSLIAQVLAILALIRMHGISGEAKGYLGMAILSLAFCAGIVIVPGTLIALARVIGGALGFIRKDEPAVQWLVFHGITALMPLILYAVVLWVYS